MAGKSLLSKLRKHGKSYKVTRTGNKVSCQSVSNGEMAGRYTSSSSSSSGASAAGGDAPPTKKRRTEEKKEEEEWDDLEFTQADLEDLEIQASQAYSKTEESHRSDPALRLDPQPSTSKAEMSPKTDTSGKFIKPLISRQSSSSSSVGSRAVNSSHSFNHSHASNHSGGSRQLNSSSSSHSSYPSSLSYDGSRTSSSLQSGSSEEISLAQRRGSLTRGISSESSYPIDVSGILSRDQSGNLSSRSDIQRLTQETASLKLQLDKMKEDSLVKDGEIKMLRENIKSHESELDRLRSEKINQIAQQNKQQTEKEKSLQVENSRLRTQCDFNEQEKRELGNRCKELEGQIRSLQVGPSSSQTLSQTQTSPGPRKVPVQKRESPKASASFPSKATFHATEGSPRKIAREDHSVQDVATETSSRHSRRHQLKVSSSGAVAGSQLVARLLHITPSSTGSLSERGIVGVLHTPAASTSAQSVTFDRDQETNLLSPSRRRISDVQTLLDAQEKPEARSIVSQEHFNMAVHGLTQLLQQDDWDPASVTASLERENISDRTDIHSVLDEHSLDHAVLILPLLNDYLSHYLSMLESSTESIMASPSTTSSSSGSFESSVESSLGLFLKDSATYANSLENLALASLRTLHVLTSCQSVRNILLMSQRVEEISDSSSSNISQRPSTSISGSNESHIAKHIPKEYIEELHLLKKVIKLADPGSKGHLFSAGIVHTSLSILTVLAQASDDLQILSLVPLISEEVIHNCIECELEPTIVCNCLDLLTSLARSNPIVSGLCVNASECVLLCLYDFCTSESMLAKCPCDTRLQISLKVVNYLSSIAGLHKGGLQILLESDCGCSVKIVQTLVLLLHNILKINEDQNTSLSFSILRKGILLLHQMCQLEHNFAHRHISVQPQYVVLILQLKRIFKNAGADQYNNELSAIQDLWDFSPDEEDYDAAHDVSHDRSHDDEADEENMDTG